jgi:Ca2+-binding EF-hand superfamily protein
LGQLLLTWIVTGARDSEGMSHFFRNGKRISVLTTSREVFWVSSAFLGVSEASYPRDMFADIPVSAVDYNEFYQILNRPDGWRPAGTEGPSPLLSFHSPTNPLHLLDEFVKGFQVFDKEGRGKIGAGELRYVLTQLGEKMTDEEVDELLKGFPVV